MRLRSDLLNDPRPISQDYEEQEVAASLYIDNSSKEKIYIMERLGTEINMYGIFRESY